jgi:salicylate 5-hydroxylase large subunit
MVPTGNTRSFTCPYHKWTYDLSGQLQGMPFFRGVNGKGGMPTDFDLSEHGLNGLAVTERNGLVFASFDRNVPPFDTFLGVEMLAYFTRVFDGRELRVLGYQRQRIPANWKLIVENIKDPYHASLLHVFLVSLGLFRADQPSQVLMDDTGQHAALISQRGTQQSNEVTEQIDAFRPDLRLHDPNLLDPAAEFPGSATVVMQTLWPNLIIQQQTNTLALRHVVPQGPETTDQHWTYFGYAEDDDEMMARRLRQANLQGPAGLIGVDDWEVLQNLQRGLRSNLNGEAVIEMGGRDIHNADHMITEVAIRAFYKHYWKVMELQ